MDIYQYLMQESKNVIFVENQIRKQGNHFKFPSGHSCILKTQAGRAKHDNVPDKIGRKCLDEYREILDICSPFFSPNMVIETGYLFRSSHLGTIGDGGALIKLYDRNINYHFLIQIEMNGDLVVQKGEL